MLRTVTVRHPEFPEGYSVEIPPLGVLKNGSTVEVDLEDDVAESLSRVYGVFIERAASTGKGGDEQ